MFTKEFFSDVRRQALRRRVWFSALDATERGILYISGKVIDDVKTTILNTQLVRIIAKLRDACKSGFVKHLEQFGMDRVRTIRVQATSFGHEWTDSAREMVL